MTTPPGSTRLWAVLLTTVGCSGGCGGGGPVADRGQPDLVAVAGTVRLDGKPLPDVEVRLVADDRSCAVGRTDAEGRFEMQFDAATPGVPLGPKRVEIRRLRPDGDQADDGLAAATAGYTLESSDRLLIERPVADLDLRLVTTPSGS